MVVIQKLVETGSIIDAIRHLPVCEDLAYDYETWGDKDARRPELNKWFQIVVVGVAYRDKVIAFPIDHPEADIDRDRVVEAWVEFITSGIPKIAHNSKYEYKCNLKRFKVMGQLICTMLMDKNIDENVGHKLGEVAARFNIPCAYKKKNEDTQANPKTTKLSKVLSYVGRDALTTLRIHRVLKPLEEEKLLDEVVARENAFARKLVNIEMNGMAVDAAAFVEIRADLEDEQGDLLKEVQRDKAVVKALPKMGDAIKSFKNGDQFNPNSPTQMKILFFDSLKLKSPKKTKTGQPSLDKLVLEGLLVKHARIPVIGTLMKYRSVSSMLTGFMNKYEDFTCPEGRVHSSYNQDVVVTGRLSSTDPNLQNIPRGSVVRRVFVSRYPDGWLIKADAKQQEPRLLAGMAQEKAMIKALQDGLNIHRFVAGRIFSVDYDAVTDTQYNVGKRMNLGLMYGQTEYGLAEKTGLDIDEAKELLDEYDHRFPDIYKWRASYHRMAAKYGYVVDLFGARRHLPNARSTNEWERQRAFRQASNFPIQRTANTFNMISFCVADELLMEIGGLVMGLVHDDVQADVPHDRKDDAVEILKHAMTVHNSAPYWKGKKVPMEAEIWVGRNLYEMEMIDG